MQPLILASASPRRAELLRQMNLPFQVVCSEATEIDNDQLTPREICQVNAYRKARAVAKKYPDSVVIGADTLVALGHKSFGKPRDLAEAGKMLKQLQGKTHQVVTGVCLLYLRKHRQKIFTETTHVTFKALKAAEILAYLGSIDPIDKAGGYAIQENGEQLVSCLDGSYSNVVGLPIERLEEMLPEVLPAP